MLHHQTIAPISHASKVLLKVIQKRIQTYLELEVPPEQAGFRKGKGTRDHIANLRWIMEKGENCKKIFSCVSLITAKHLIASTIIYYEETSKS